MNKNKDSIKKVLSNEITMIPNLNVFCIGSGNKTMLPLIEHTHKEKFEFIIVKNGVQEIIVDNIQYTLYEGDAVIISPNELHYAKEPEADTVIIWFQIDINNLEHFLGLPDTQVKAMIRLLAEIKSRKLILTNSITDMFISSFGLLEAQADTQKLNGYLQFLTAFYNMLTSETDNTVLSEDIQKAISYIRSNIKETIDINELLVVTRMDTKEFKETFVKQTGLTPREYINSEKIKSAMKEIKSTDKDIYDIIYDYSFASPSFFKVTFKKMYGYTPNKFRKLSKRGKL